MATSGVGQTTPDRKQAHTTFSRKRSGSKAEPRMRPIPTAADLRRHEHHTLVPGSLPTVRFGHGRVMAGQGHEERFPPTRLSAGRGFRKETIAGMRRNGRDAPKAAVLTT